jgi:hypothetical protein
LPLAANSEIVNPGLILYGLQTASINLCHTNFEARRVTDVVIDPDTVDATCLHGPQWFAEDFESASQNEEASEQESNQDSADAEVPPAKNEAKEGKEVSAEEVRKQVRSVVRTWLSEEAK